MKKIILAGASGYLGRYIAYELLERGYEVTLLVRNLSKVKTLPAAHIKQVNFLDKESLRGCFQGADAVISSLGITRQRDGLSYMDVDFGVNMSLLNMAKEEGVKKFVYVSVLKGDKLQHLEICKAKERFVSALKKSGLDYSIIRPNGFFSDMREFYNMAENGRVFLFGNGEQKTNPIHGNDLAKICVKTLFLKNHEKSVGGPQVLTHKNIAEHAFESLQKPIKITFIPLWFCKLVLFCINPFSKNPSIGSVQFFLNVMQTDMKAPKDGVFTIKEYFYNLSKA